MDNKTRVWREDYELRKNGEGYSDPTAYQAIKQSEAEERYKKFIGCVYRIAELSGFYVEDIVVTDRRTGETRTK